MEMKDRQGSAGQSVLRFDMDFVPPALRSAADKLLPAAEIALQKLIRRECVGAEWTGWFDWPRTNGQALSEKIISSAANLRSSVKFDTVVVIGIGGSYLGTRCVVDALSHSYGGAIAETSGAAARAGARPLIVYAGHHLSEVGLLELLEFLETREPIVNVVSKSGTTTEPAVAFRLLRAMLERRYGAKAAAARIIATTDPKSGALRKLADLSGWQTWPVPQDVGGRYSVLTAVGLVPLALGGFDILAMTRGADLVFSSLCQRSASDHGDNSRGLRDAVLRYATLRNAAHASGKRLEVLNFSEPKLAMLAEWWKQLFGESEGKDGKGIFPVSLCSTTDLHSLGQIVQEGERNLFETFLSIESPGRKDVHGAARRLRVPSDQTGLDELGFVEQRLIGEVNDAASLATRIAHADGGVPNVGLRLGQLDEFSLGAFFAFMETACAVSAALFGVNPFDQPGVEAYKRNLFGLMGKKGFEDLGRAIRSRCAERS